jgi:hypothetical protein
MAALHWINLTWVDEWMRDLVLATEFVPVAVIVAIEGDAVRSLQALHGPVQDFLFTWFYLVFHHALVVVIDSRRLLSCKHGNQPINDFDGALLSTTHSWHLPASTCTCTGSSTLLAASL